MSEVKYPFRMTSIYNDGKNNIQSNYSGINAVKDFNDFAERNKLKWAILIDESNGKIIDSFNCHPERDTYRDLCAELLDQLYRSLPFVEDHEGSELYKSGALSARIKSIKSAITKAEKILGEKNGTSN